MVFRVSTANPNYSPENVTEFIANDINGLTVSSDSKTVYVTSLANGVYAFPTDQGFPQYPYIISNIVDAFGIVIPSKCLIETGGLSGNNLRLANYLNEYAPDAITDLVCNLDPGALSSALESLSPASNAFPAFIADYGLFSASQMVSDNLSQQRNNNATTEEEPVAALDQFKDPSVLTASETDQMAKPRLELHRPPTPVGKHAVWVELLGGVGYQKSQRQTAGFSVGSGGLMTAAEYRWEKVLLGGGLSYLYNSSKQDWHRGHSTTNQGMAAIYSEFTLPNFYTNGSLWGGYYHVDKTRHISTPRRKGTATSHSHGWQFMPHFEIGGQVKRGYFTLEPFASADWSNNWKRGYSEHGAPGLNMKHRHRHSSMLRTESGLRFYEKILYSWGALTFIEKLSYVHRQPFGTGNEVASLVGSPGSFKTSTLDVAQNLGVGEFEIIYNPNQDRLPKCTLGYQGEFGSISQAHQVFLTIKMLF